MDFLARHAQRAKVKVQRNRFVAKRRGGPREYREHCQCAAGQALSRVRALRLKFQGNATGAPPLDDVLLLSSKKKIKLMDKKPSTATSGATVSHTDMPPGLLRSTRQYICTCPTVLLKLPRFAFRVPRTQGCVGSLRSVPVDSIMISLTYLEIKDLAALGVAAKGLALICSDNKLWQPFCEQQLKAFADVETTTAAISNWRMEYKWRKQRKRQARLWRLNMSMGRVGRIKQIARPQGCGFSYYGMRDESLTTNVAGGVYGQGEVTCTQPDDVHHTHTKACIASEACAASEACIKNLHYTYASEMGEVSHQHAIRPIESGHGMRSLGR